MHSIRVLGSADTPKNVVGRVLRRVPGRLARVHLLDAPPLARSWAINKLRALGWLHVAAPGLPSEGRAHAESSWTGETYCFECANNAKMRLPRGGRFLS